MSVLTAPMRAVRPQQQMAVQSQRLSVSNILPAFSGLRLSRGMPVPSQESTAAVLEAPTNGATTFAMRHGNKKIKLNLPADQRKALMRSLTTEVLRHGKIKTTKPRAKAIRKYVDKMITLAKTGTLHARRQALSFVFDESIVKSLFEQAPVRYGDRQGGYCRVTTEIQKRRGDNAEMATIELV